MAATPWKQPVTREEALQYYTITRHDTWASVATVVDCDEQRSRISTWRRWFDIITLPLQAMRNAVVQVASTFRLWLCKSTQVISSLCRNWWLIELTSWCIGAFCMVLIATLLAAWDGRPLPDRFPLGLKLNAYVSVLSAIAKLALAVCLEEALATQKYLWYTTATPKHSLLDFEKFELAARRPIGALKLIWQMRARSFATLGAVIFLLSLALDPFFQQLLSFPSRPSLENPSKVSRLVRLFNNNKIVDADGGNTITADMTMRSVVPTFFRGNTSLYPLDTFCPGETCTWPEFETLAICSSCEDISSFLSHGCMEESGDWRMDFDPEPPRTNATRSKSCGWFFNATSDDPVMMTGYNLEGHGTLLSRHFPYHGTVKNDLYWNGSLLSKHVPQPLADFAAVSSSSFEAVHRNETPQAISCTWRWCVKRMSASFSEGVYKETELSVFTNDTEVPEPLSCVTEADGTRQWKYDGNITLTPPNSTTSYFIEDNTMLTARFAIDAYIPNMIIQPNATAAIAVHYPQPTEEDGGPHTETAYNNLWLQPGEAKNVVNRFTEQLTNMLRNDPRFSEAVHGSGIFVTYIVVEWSFFAFPLVVLVLTMGLLIATILQTHRKDVWKTSDLTTLVHGLSEDAKFQLKEARTMLEVRSLAKDLPIYLTAYNEGRRQLDVASIKPGANPPLT